MNDAIDKALKVLRGLDNWINEGDWWFGDPDRGGFDQSFVKEAIAALTTLSAADLQPAPSVAVKALEWSEINEILEEAEAAPFGIFYHIEDDPDGYALDLNDDDLGSHSTLELAKAAAQSDYEARIRSALSAQAQDVAGWQLVPKEPTEEMLDAYRVAETKKRFDIMSPYPTEEPEAGGGTIGYGYRAMLAAAPAKQES